MTRRHDLAIVLALLIGVIYCLDASHHRAWGQSEDRHAFVVGVHDDNLDWLLRLSPFTLANLDEPISESGNADAQLSPHIGLDDTIENSVGMKFCLIPAGEFLMGSPHSEVDDEDDEMQHRVKITREFYMGTYEVTQEQYERVMGANPSYFQPGEEGEALLDGTNSDDFPVECVSWEDAVSFCARLNEIEEGTGRNYRLPTEAEWEYACRAGTTSLYSFGDSCNGREANIDGSYPYGTTVTGAELGRPTSVGSYAANAFGLYDMHGNVLEWCSDWYLWDYYSESPIEDPTGPATGSHRVMRGGSWDDFARYARSASRSHGTESFRFHPIGFRVVCSIE